MNGKLLELANFHLGNNVMSRLTNDNALPKATSSTASACLEVTDATCVIMATMRSIILKHNSEQNNMLSESVSVSLTNQMEGILQCVEMALELSKKKEELETVSLLEHAIWLMRTKSTNKQRMEAVDNNVIELGENNKCHRTKKVKLNNGDNKSTGDKPKQHTQLK